VSPAERGTEQDEPETGVAGDAEDGRPLAGRDRGVVAFDNSGTVSDVVVEMVAFTDDADYDVPVPGVRTDRPTALVNVALEDLGVLDTDASLGTVLGETGTDVHLALSNVEVGRSEATATVLADADAAARPLFDATERLRERVIEEGGHGDPPVGVQLTVELEPGTVHRGFAYVSVPRSESRSTVAAVRERGFDVHLVSGDAVSVLEAVASHVGVPAGNVHALQSPADKGETLGALRERTDGPVVMVGDYVNDRLAFERADRAVLVCREEEPDPSLARRVDAVAGSLSEVLTRL
jgi:soluble P-type ATPase